MSRRGLLLLAAAALAVRLAYDAVAMSGYAPLADALHYHGLATAVAEGRGLEHPFPTGDEHPTAFRPPLWPLLLGALYAVTGPSLGAAQVLTAVLGSLAAVGVAVLASRVAGPVAAVAAGVTAAVHPELVAGDAPPLSEPLGSVLLVGVLLAAAARRPALAGALTGALLLTRPSAQAVALLLAGWVLVALGWRRALAFVLVVAAVLAPWLVRNTVEVGAPVLTTSQGFNLAAAYSETALSEGGFVDPVYDWRFSLVRAEATRRVDPGSPPGALELERDREYREAGLEGLRDDPLAPVGVVVRNAGRLLALPGQADAATADRLDGRPAAVRPVVHAVGAALLGVGAVGLLLAAARRLPLAAPLLLTAVGTTGASLLTVAAPRLRQPLDLLACVGVGVVVALVLRQRAVRRGAPPCRHSDLSVRRQGDLAT